MRKRERRARAVGQRGMAADEQQSQPIVFDPRRIIILRSWRRRCDIRFERPRPIALERKRSIASRRDTVFSQLPGFWGTPSRGQATSAFRVGFLQHILGDVEVAGQPNQTGEDAPAVGPHETSSRMRARTISSSSRQRRAA